MLPPTGGEGLPASLKNSCGDHQNQPNSLKRRGYLLVSPIDGKDSLSPHRA